MTHFVTNAQDSATVSLHAAIRRAELNAQDWNRDKAAELAQQEGISLHDEHWAVITYLRNAYVEYGLPRFAGTTARTLNRKFSAQGGSKYLYGLFAGGPVTQGGRLANLPRPEGTIDLVSGTR